MSFFFGFFGFSILGNKTLTGLTGSCSVVLVGYDSFYKTFVGLFYRKLFKFYRTAM